MSIDSIYESMSSQAEGIMLTGHNNSNMIIDFNGIKAVRRIPRDTLHDMDIRAIPEKEILAALSGKGIAAPSLLQQDGDMIVMSLMPGDVLADAYGFTGRLPEWIVQDIGYCMAELHNKRYPAIERYKDAIASSPRQLYAVLQEKIEEIASSSYGSIGGICELLEIPLDNLFQGCEGDSNILEDRQMVLCHCDVHRRNVLADEDAMLVSLIDWELACYADPLYDIAVALQKLRLPPDEERLLIDSYFEESKTRETKTTRRQIDAYRKLEIVKYSVTDILRVVESIRDGYSTGEWKAEIERYAVKLANAYRVWGKDDPFDSNEIMRAFNAAFKGRLS